MPSSGGTLVIVGLGPDSFAEAILLTFEVLLTATAAAIDLEEVFLIGLVVESIAALDLSLPLPLDLPIASNVCKLIYMRTIFGDSLQNLVGVSENYANDSQFAKHSR
jgi:hypothetical protein